MCHGYMKLRKMYLGDASCQALEHMVVGVYKARYNSVICQADCIVCSGKVPW